MSPSSGNNEVIGVAAFEVEKGFQITVHGLVVSGNRRGSGIGSVMRRALYSIGRKAGAKTIVTDVAIGGTNFWHRAGFRYGGSYARHPPLFHNVLRLIRNI